MGTMAAEKTVGTCVKESKYRLVLKFWNAEQHYSLARIKARNRNISTFDFFSANAVLFRKEKERQHNLTKITGKTGEGLLPKKAVHCWVGGRKNKNM